jgi:molecular chaperone DnaJ
VSESATQEEIKKAFREKSKIVHPDKGGNEEDFKKINEAYDTLGDANKRSNYDNQKNNPFGGGGNPFDIFNEMFNGGGFGGFNNVRRKVPDLIVDIQIGTVDSFLGKNIEVNFNRKIKCEPCNGQGGERVTCQTCNGSGVITHQVGNSFFSNIVRTSCNSCQGKGFNFRNVCNHCNGDGRKNDNVKLNVNLPHGISDGQFIKAEGYGNFSEGQYGDVILKINVVPQNGFDKSGGDLIYNYYLTLEDVNKDSIVVPYPTGDISLNLPKEIDTQKPLRVKGKGFQSEGGDFYVKLNFKHTRL